MTSNIFDDLPKNMPKEVVQMLIRAADVRTERIISHGHASAVDWTTPDEPTVWLGVRYGDLAAGEAP